MLPVGLHASQVATFLHVGLDHLGCMLSSEHGTNDISGWFCGFHVPITAWGRCTEGPLAMPGALALVHGIGTLLVRVVCVVFKSKVLGTKPVSSTDVLANLNRSPCRCRTELGPGTGMWSFGEMLA